MVASFYVSTAASVICKKKKLKTCHSGNFREHSKEREATTEKEGDRKKKHCDWCTL